ncbi:MAG TPA: choice-of-anchor R domain-containing protein [Verrucomicrobiae bacterium]|nr:choice-of-anchor R domain-containing protein [Verrucomicrobiae bacterium]
MDGAEGNPSGFNVSIHTSSTGLLNGQPNNRLGNLVGSDPSAGGIFTYTASDLTLSPSTVYYLVLSATTTATQGAYNWSATDASITGGKEGWFIGNFYFGSTDGSNWQPSRQEIPQLGIFATPIPEPGVLGLLGLGGIAALWCRRKNSPQKNRH